MRLDHVSYAAEPDGLRATAERIGKALGVEPVDGGLHPRFGTRNVVIPLSGQRYVEVVDVLDHPASDKAPFGQAVRSRCENGGGWLGWVVAVDDLSPVEAKLGRDAVNGNRHRPDGVELRWRQIGVKGLIADPQLPFLISWDCDRVLHPSNTAATDVRLEGVTIAGHPDRVRNWLGLSPDYTPDCINFTFVAPNGTPGLLAVSFSTADGPVEI
ncbi:MAG: VOC family protein [Actinomycetes bacterium]